MKRLIVIFFSAIIFYGCNKSNDPGNDEVTKNSEIKQTNMNTSTVNIHDVTVKDMFGNDKKLSDYKGKVLMIVNVASQCGFTTQYKGMQKIYEDYKDEGFEVLGFPCNDFGAQEPGTNEEIRTFCENKYDVTFDTFDKIKILGDNKNRLYEKLTQFPADAGDVKWNFEKFIIDKEGNVVARYRSKIKPESDEVTEVIREKLKG
jgi:glutathione peroxidase